MLKREQAEKQLATLRVKNWEKARLEAVGKLPEKLATVGRTLLGRGANGKPFSTWKARRAAEEKAWGVLAGLPEKDRVRLFATFHPQLGDVIEAGYQFIPKLTLPGDRPFRAPSDPDRYEGRRFDFVQNLIRVLEGYDQDIAWVAAWAPHLSGGWVADEVGTLLAAAIDAGRHDVLEILKLSTTNDHEVGSMGRHVVMGMLMASRPDGWEFMEKTLLAAQRQEGLRQVILESVQEAHPDAFRRMLGVILDNNLIRFSSVTLAVDEWFGLQWSALTPATIKKTMTLAHGCLTDPDRRADLLARGNGEDAYLALWCTAFDDARAGLDAAKAMLGDEDVERRYVALRLIEDLPFAKEVQPYYEKLLDDPDLRIALTALERLGGGKDRWDALLKLRDRLPPKRKNLEPLVWPWVEVKADRRDIIGQLMDNMGRRKSTDLLPFIDEMESYQKAQLVGKLAKMKKWDATTRETLFRLVGDRDGYVRQAALKALKKCDVTEAEAQAVEKHLTKKGSELRQGVLALLARQKSEPALASVDRLLGSKKEPLRHGGLELMRVLVEKKKAVAECRARGQAYKEAAAELTDDEEMHLDVILDVKREKPTLDNALGLMNPADRSPVIEPKDRRTAFVTPAAVALLKSLDELVTANKKKPVRMPNEEVDTLLGNIQPWMFPDPDEDEPRDKNLAALPLAETWCQWYEKRPKAMRDGDGMELLRAEAWANTDKGFWSRGEKRFPELVKRMMNGQQPVKLKHANLVGNLIQWLRYLYPLQKVEEFALDAVETSLSLVPKKERERVVKLDDWRESHKDWRNNWVGRRWLNRLDDVKGDALKARAWQLMHWRDQPAPGVGRMRPDTDLLLAACKAGMTTDADLYDALIGPAQRHFSDLARLTQPTAGEPKALPQLGKVLDRIRERLVELETTRGEPPTAATQPAGNLMSLFGTATFFRLLASFGKRKLERVSWGSGDGKAATLSRLLTVTYPADGDTAEGFAEQAKAAGLSEQQLIELAFHAPQWLPHVQHAVGWDGLTEGVWWFLAHMPSGKSGLNGAEDADDLDVDDDDDFDLDDDEEAPAAPRQHKLSPWEKIIRERCPLTAEERENGAVDPAWFHRVYQENGPKRWDAIAAAAKFGCRGNDAKKAVRLSEVLLGRADRGLLVQEVSVKKLKESVRLLGLLPLPGGAKRDAELTARYKVLVEYRRYAKSLGPMSRESSVQTATMGLQNLARTAGYPDPIRLEWAMEAREYADLAQGPLSVTQDGLTVTLSIDDQAKPEVTVRRGEKPLKTIPPAVRKAPKVAALLEKRTELKRSASRVKQSLEGMMVRGDAFTGTELVHLFGHPLLRPLLERLVIEGEGVRGYPVSSGQGLRDHTGKVEPVKKAEVLRLTHPYDLFQSGEWHLWQADCFAAERVQPLKQVFRELYVLTAQEKDDATFSARYAGHQVNPGQAMALFGSRGWATSDGVSKTFHDLGIRAEIGFKHHGWTSSQVEGLTLDEVRFYRRGEWQPMKLAEVPPRVFSEVMRDGDLVVAVAHVGGVDPEASASTVEMRAALVRETAGLFRLENVTVKDRHAFIKGTLGSYTVHLGSANVHRQPGGHVCIVPVHSQHMGRLFLPFADADPRTAEVISKVLLLARDHEIQDPTILDQLR